MGVGSLTMTYFLTEEPQYHRRGFVSRSCSGWEGVVPKRYGRQTLTGLPGGADMGAPPGLAWKTDECKALGLCMYEWGGDCVMYVQRLCCTLLCSEL